ncbi:MULTISPECIES: DNA (cytosine-5-)-methyltransferase [unclassified Mesorhizobium]|uniref:DNA (cytosine-5-)-methyltransferase n=1 Tax=unclassified Mesorhizobium TaxID=325217 RepID=UPI000FCCCD7B|nr:MULTISPECIES: DNA (cytosine-5-)-methyltransferase [unclassified Mesorhizobium]TGP29074.1 DNA (cytosine-5-)-methyltransferase [Mesorhizobium sp. M2D.F.Ca.ET.232.01.1.1]TGQ24608.1 DNA (cytosine-5-)-methyltransferase [Mesorhizobium sp. M00.F.Ca.ET.220.01.1.1]TGU12205.1 DNA (cytosine-5-)-methyltransferase [bacterium M00.F.Ca.ET.163.01.1.1]
MSDPLLRVLDLFSGIGGFTKGLEEAGGYETAAFVEINPDRQDDLRRMWPGVPIFNDVRAVHAADVGQIDVITGGFPCQDISTAGRRTGIHGERTGLFSEIVRLAGELRPVVINLENSADLLTGDGGAWARHVFGQLAALGYDIEWHVIPASGLGAPHVRERVWIIATDARSEFQAQRRHKLYLGRRFTRTGEAAAVVADHYRERELQSGWVFTDKRGRTVHDPEHAWPETWIEKLSSLRSMDDGLPAGLATAASHRFGNTVVPHIPKLIGRAILEARFQP